jgi:3D-(3,5/4)-trihydroxycyclohexane-1,2-dione acylhydrolase (decyclizing)
MRASGLDELDAALQGWTAPASWTARSAEEKSRWSEVAARYTGATNAELALDAQVIGAVQRSVDRSTIVVCAAGGLPGELHKLWQASEPLGYHLEYGYSCMGYEIAGARREDGPSRPRGRRDGGRRLVSHDEFGARHRGDAGQEAHRVVLDNRGFGCINRLQRATGGESFNNLLRTPTT